MESFKNMVPQVGFGEISGRFGDLGEVWGNWGRFGGIWGWEGEILGIEEDLEGNWGIFGGIWGWKGAIWRVWSQILRWEELILGSGRDLGSKLRSRALRFWGRKFRF